METAGAQLKKIRLEKGLSLEDVQKKTKIHLNILKAIEEDSLVNFSPVYIKGFLKIYCKFLGVDPRNYIPDYKEAPAVASYTAEEKRKPVSFLPRINMKAALIAALALALITGAFKLGKIISSRKPRSFSPTAKLPAIISAKVEKKPPVNLQKIPAATVIRLGMHAKENSYVSVKADGRVVFQGILRKGMSEAWPAKNKIELSLGDAGAVELQINDKMISRVGRKGQAVKGISITREGLSIPR